MRISRGEYPIPSRNLVLDLQGDMDVANGRAIYYLCGENGVGKTTFLEQVLIPALQQADLPFLYLGQDMGMQLYTLRASLAMAGHGLASLDESQMIRLWLREGQVARACLLDEFDKYLPDYGPILREGAAFLRTFVMVSHLAPNGMRQLLPDHAAYRVPFQLAAVESGIRRVTVNIETWS